MAENNWLGWLKCNLIEIVILILVLVLVVKAFSPDAPATEIAVQESAVEVPTEITRTVVVEVPMKSPTEGSPETSAQEAPGEEAVSAEEPAQGAPAAEVPLEGTPTE